MLFPRKLLELYKNPLLEVIKIQEKVLLCAQKTEWLIRCRLPQTMTKPRVPQHFSQQWRVRPSQNLDDTVAIVVVAVARPTRIRLAVPLDWKQMEELTRMQMVRWNQS